jgi:hypothetical protein
MNADFVGVWNAVAVLVAVVFEKDSLFELVRAEQVGVDILIAGCDQRFKLQLVEVVREIVKEVADLWIVRVG